MQELKPMRRIAFLFVFVGAALLIPRTTVAENIPAQVGITVSCDCADSTGKAYGAAIKQLLSDDADLRQIRATPNDADGAMTIRVTSKALPVADGIPRVALTVLYRHGGKTMQQTIQTCTHAPLQLTAALLVHEVKQLELESDGPAGPDANTDNPILTASAR